MGRLDLWYSAETRLVPAVHQPVRGTGGTAENSTPSTRSSRFRGEGQVANKKQERDSTQGEAKDYGAKHSQSGGKGEATGGFV